jgi:hypothetical protein
MLEPGAWDGVLEGKAAWSFHPPAANTAVRGLCSERVAGSWGLLGGQLGRLRLSRGAGVYWTFGLRGGTPRFMGEAAGRPSAAL